jgi:hypothetical protein
MQRVSCRKAIGVLGMHSRGAAVAAAGMSPEQHTSVRIARSGKLGALAAAALLLLLPVQAWARQFTGGPSVRGHSELSRPTFYWGVGGQGKVYPEASCRSESHVGFHEQ